MYAELEGSEPWLFILLGVLSQPVNRRQKKKAHVYPPKSPGVEHLDLWEFRNALNELLKVC